MVDHHWLKYGKEEEFIPNLDKFGFVYLITNLQNGKGYIGCKQYLMYRKLKETESNWKRYMGSSKWLLKDIEKIGKEHFKFEIIAEYKNRRSLRYYELYYQMKFNVLSSILEGTDEPAYYNSRVGGKFYRPVESYQDPEYLKKLAKSFNTIEYKKNMSKAMKKVWGDPEYKKKTISERKYYKDPEFKKKMSNSVKNSEAYMRTRNDPKIRKKISEGLKQMWKDPVYKKKRLETIKNSKAHKKAVRDPEFRKKQAELIKKKPRDPVTGRLLKQNVQTK